MRHIAVVTLALLAASCGGQEIRDFLTNPVKVVSANADLLVLADGTKRTVPHVSELIAAFPRISAVEVKPDGSLWCLIGVERECGNDPIRTRVEKVPLVSLIDALWSEPFDPNSAATRWRGNVTVGAFSRLVSDCGGTWDGQSSATFPGE